jgi:predicted Holliday junction resolvase-like endonuclease
MTKKTTIFLDPRSIEQKELEQTEEQIKQQLEEQERQETIEKGVAIVNGLIAYLVILPLLFMFAFNMSLTKMFSLDRIGYVESLGVVIVARVLRGKRSNG